MANPLYRQFGTPIGNIGNSFEQLMAEAQRLSGTIQNPRQMVEHLMQTGQMSQNQFNQLSQMANSMFGRR